MTQLTTLLISTSPGGSSATDSSATVATSGPLCIDLDDSLARSDLLFEAFAHSLRYEPRLALEFIIRLIRDGKAAAKTWLAEHGSFEVALVPLHNEVVDWIRGQVDEHQRSVYLVTASPQRWANLVGARVGMFKECIGSDKERNLKGARKAQYLVERFGKGGFDYLGDSEADFEVWRQSGTAHIVSSDESFIQRVKEIAPVGSIISGRKPYSLRLIAKALRIHQWIKNILIFLPVIAAHMIGNIGVWWYAIVAFLSFSCAASTVYLLNDLCDLESDRQHRTKHTRPLASCELRIQDGLFLAPALLAISLLLAFSLSGLFVLVLGAYLVMTTLYSFWLKRRAMVDIVVLSGLYTTRIIAGASATAIPVSTWLFSFSMFFFFSLACAKRFGELVSKDEAETQVPGRGYYYGDRELIGILGVSSAVTSVLVLALYVTAQEVVRLYSHPPLLLLTCPLVLLWISRIWLTAFRDQLDDDPIVHALQYKGSYIIGTVFFMILLAAK
jgi:4-hydroxybenzoate polyprenyltransferase